MKIIGIRIFGVTLLIFGLNMFLSGTWANIDQHFARETYKAGKKIMVHVDDQAKAEGLKNPLDGAAFQKDLEHLSNEVIQYSQDYVFRQRLSTYLFSALSIIIGVFYCIAGVGTLRFRSWARLYGFIAAGLWPVFYIHLIYSIVLHIGFLDEIVGLAQETFQYVNTANPYAEMAIMSAAKPKLILVSILTTCLFSIGPAWFFLSPAITEELD